MAINASFVGRLGADSELKYSKAGKAFLSLRVATDSGYGENKKTDWVSVTMFGTRAETLATHLVKGKQIFISGRLTGREYEGAKGKGFSLDVIADDIEFVGGNTKAASNDDQEVTTPNGKAYTGTAAPF